MLYTAYMQCAILEFLLKKLIILCIYYLLNKLLFLKGWLTGFFLGLIVFMGCSLFMVFMLVFF